MRRATVLLCAFGVLASGGVDAQEALIKAEELVRLEDIPLSRPASFEAQHPPEQLDYLAWLTTRALDSSTSWNPRNRAWTLYRANIRYGLEQSLRERWASSAGVIRSLSENPDTSIAQFYADRLSLAQLDQALEFYRSPAGKAYIAYQRQLKRVYYVGRLELERIAIDPEFAALGESVADRRKAWLAKKKVSLESVPPGYAFHVRTAQALLPGQPPDNVVFALLAGAPLGSEAFLHLDSRMSADERSAVQRYLDSAAAGNEKKARAEWAEKIARLPDALPLLFSDVRSVVDVVARWRKVRADPRSLPRSIVQVDPATVKVADDYARIDVRDPAVAGAIKACIANASDETIRKVIDGTKAPNYLQVVSVLSHPEGNNIWVMRQGQGVCVPTTIPGYPVPAQTSFTGTVRVIGMDEAETREWRRGVSQDIAAYGASVSLIVMPNRNAFEVTYAVNVQSPQSLVYGSRFLFAGTYELQAYRIVRDNPGFKSMSMMGSRSASSDVVRYEKSLVTTQDELRREAERSARDSKN
jgi:hypothetical protein